MSALVMLLLLRDNTKPAIQPGDSSPTAVAVAASSVVRGTPSMGVACSTPNALSCDRVGMQVRLEDPAARITATLAGMSFPLDNSDWGPDPAKRPVKRFTGYLNHAGLRTPGQPHVLEKSNGRYRWLESAPAKLPVTLRIERGDGTIQTTRVRVWLAGGWG